MMDCSKDQCDGSLNRSKEEKGTIEKATIGKSSKDKGTLQDSASKEQTGSDAHSSIKKKKTKKRRNREDTIFHKRRSVDSPDRRYTQKINQTKKDVFGSKKSSKSSTKDNMALKIWETKHKNKQGQQKDDSKVKSESKMMMDIMKK